MSSLLQLHDTHVVAHAIGVIALVCGAGMALGSVKIGGIGLGTAGVLFAGLVAGHLGKPVDQATLDFVKELGLVLFVFTIGPAARTRLLRRAARGGGASERAGGGRRPPRRGPRSGTRPAPRPLSRRRPRDARRRDHEHAVPGSGAANPEHLARRRPGPGGATRARVRRELSRGRSTAVAPAKACPRRLAYASRYSATYSCAERSQE
jgi:hypothetical protein